jgi:hypothetical protein
MPAQQIAPLSPHLAAIRFTFDGASAGAIYLDEIALLAQ